MTKLETEALDRLKRRHARLGRLLELGAPAIILANEAVLIGEAGQLLAPEAHFTVLREKFVKLSKHGLGLCEEEGCEEPVEWREGANSGGPRGPFSSACCLAHAQALEAEHNEVVGNGSPTLELVP